MNYRHAYHAGNFGDVLKHLVLIALLEKLTQKDKPLFFLDTHAGRGLYDLEGTLARRAGEADAGIQRLAAVADLPPLAQRYLELVRGCDPANAEKLRYYPGSPLIAAMLLRDDDRAALCEIQPREAAGLREVFGRDRRIAVHERDGYEALRGLLPPRQGRGLVLIDPPYESQERELDDVAEALGLAVARWPVGVFAAWYPIKLAQSIARFHARLAAGVAGFMAIEMSLFPEDSRAGGLNGAGMIVVNPPWQFEERVAASLPAVHAALAPAGAGGVRIRYPTPARS